MFLLHNRRHQFEKVGTYVTNTGLMDTYGVGSYGKTTQPNASYPAMNCLLPSLVTAQTLTFKKNRMVNNSMNYNSSLAAATIACAVNPTLSVKSPEFQPGHTAL